MWVVMKAVQTGFLFPRLPSTPHLDCAPALPLELAPENRCLQSDAPAISVSVHSKSVLEFIVSDFAGSRWPCHFSHWMDKTYPAYIPFSPCISWSLNNPTGFSRSSDLRAISAQWKSTRPEHPNQPCHTILSFVRSTRTLVAGEPKTNPNILESPRFTDQVQFQRRSVPLDREFGQRQAAFLHKTPVARYPAVDASPLIRSPVEQAHLQVAIFKAPGRWVSDAMDQKNHPTYASSSLSYSRASLALAPARSSP